MGWGIKNVFKAAASIAKPVVTAAKTAANVGAMAGGTAGSLLGKGIDRVAGTNTQETLARAGSVAGAVGTSALTGGAPVGALAMQAENDKMKKADQAAANQYDDASYNNAKGIANQSLINASGKYASAENITAANDAAIAVGKVRRDSYKTSTPSRAAYWNRSL